MANHLAILMTKNKKVKGIIDTAFKEFSIYGIKKASLNNILKEAHISKGVFYHYFKDKNNLFEHLLKYVAELNIDAVDQMIKWDSDDIILRISEVSKYRFIMMKRHSFMIEFYNQFVDEIFNHSTIGNIKEWREHFYKFNVNFEKFKDNTVIDETLHIIKWSFKGLFMTDKLLDDDAINQKIKKCDQLYKVLATHFYKEIDV